MNCMGEERTARTRSDHGEAGERSDGDEHGRDRGHDLRVLVPEVLEQLTRVDEPERGLGNGRGDGTISIGRASLNAKAHFRRESRPVYKQRW